MKLAYPIGTPETKSKMLAYTGDLAEMMRRLKEIGYTGLEPFVRNPLDMDRSAFAKLVEKYGFDIAAVGTGPVVSDDKLTFTAADESVRKAAIQRAKDIAVFAADFGSQMNVGKLRGEIDPQQPELSWRRMNEAFDEVCEFAAKRNTVITLEPQNQFVINNLNSTHAALDWVRERGHDNLRMMLDVFHMNIEDPSFAASMIEARDYTLHLHFADSNRLAPGQGGIPFAEIVRVLKALRYNKYITMEVRQAPDCHTAAERSYEYIRRILREK
jgi:sugar phosphate isomerase/epimerase